MERKYTKAKRNLILATCVTSALASIVGMVSLGTEQWVNAITNFRDSSLNTQDSYINYGLFGGTYERYLPSRYFYQITITCSSDGQACAMLCGNSPDNRERQLELLLAGDEHIEFDSACPKIQRNIKVADLPKSFRQTPRATGNRTYIDYGIYASTVAFLVISIVLGVASVGLSVWNTIGNPIYRVLNVDGIICLNAVAAVTVTLTMILWGVQYNITLIDNIGILETITDVMETLEPSLGYSFWINIASILLYCTNVFLILMRKILLAREPVASNMVMLKSDDRTIVLF